MASASPDNIKQWKFPDGNFIQNLSGHSSIVNALAVNQDGVLVSGGQSCRFLFIRKVFKFRIRVVTGVGLLVVQILI